MWKGQHCGREVAAKVLRVYSKGGFEKPRKVGLRWLSRLFSGSNDLPVRRVEVLQGGRNMERPAASQRATIVGCDDDGDSICDGVGVDGKG